MEDAEARFASLLGRAAIGLWGDRHVRPGSMRSNLLVWSAYHETKQTPAEAPGSLFRFSRPFVPRNNFILGRLGLRFGCASGGGGG
jgi:hypothetical protein